jgi:peroxiredoxin Q/BCP
MQKTPYQAPDFTIDGTSLSDFRGQWLVLYFYPKDDTPGCIIEACSFRDARDELINLGANVIGISKDDASSHEKFKEKHTLNFTLLSDPEGTVIKAYGAWGKKMFGREGILRKTFIINPEGHVVKIYGRVTPMGHGAKVIEDLKKLQRN